MSVVAWKSIAAGAAVLMLGSLSWHGVSGGEYLDAASGQSACKQPWDFASEGLYVSAVVRGRRSYLPYAATDGRLTALFASVDGGFERLRDRIERLDGQVLFADPLTGYVRASVPLDAWPGLRCLEDVEAAQLASPLSVSGSWIDPAIRFLPLPARTETTAPPSPRIESGSSTPASDAPLPVIGRSDALLGLDRLQAAHPEFDGRGVTIAILESRAGNLNASHPAFSTARNLSGQVVPKIADWIEPDFTDSNPYQPWERTLVRADAQWDVAGRIVFADGAYYTLPSPGRYSIGRFSFEGRTLTVLWSAGSSTAWIDVNQNRHFEDDMPIVDARKGTSTPVLPSTQWRSGVGISVLVRSSEHLAVYCQVDDHSPMTASVAAGARVGQFSGVAPSARLVLVSSTPSTHGYLEALLRTVQRQDVDLVSASVEVPVTLPQSSRALTTVMIDRIVERYGKPVFETAGNQGAFEETSATSARTITVGSFDPSDTIAESFDGAMVGQRDWVWRYMSGGRLSGGRPKPDVLAPSLRLAANSCGVEARTLSDGRVIPACYSISGGTSTAAPMIAGLSARLLGAAKATGLHVTPADLKWALRESSRYLDTWPTYDQGAGVPQADVAWRLLVEKAERPVIRMRASVRHVLSAYGERETLDALVEREGWVPGQSGIRELQFLRESGADRPVRYSVHWIGNDGTFVAPTTIDLPLGTIKNVPLRIHPKTTGIHSARLQLKASGVAEAAYEASVVIVAAPELSGHTRRHSVLRTEERDLLFFKVPAGHASLELDLRVHKGTVLMKLEEPAGWKPFRLAFASDALAFVPASTQKSVTIVDPMPGTWVLVIHNNLSRRRSLSQADREAEYDLTLRSVPTPSVENVRLDNETIRAQLRSPLSAETVVVHSELAAPVVQRQAILSRLPKTDRQFMTSIEMDVPEGATGIYASATFDQPTGGHLYVFDCTGSDCRRVASLVPGRQMQKWYLRSPAAGRWVLAATPGPSGDTAVQLAATYAHPRLGTVEDVAVSANPGRRVTFKQVMRPRTSPIGGLLVFPASTRESTTSKSGPQVQSAPLLVELPLAGGNLLTEEAPRDPRRPN